MNSHLNHRLRAGLLSWIESPRRLAPAVTTRRKPRGFTLIEVGVAATLAAVVMGGATALLVGIMRTNSAVHERLEQISLRSHLANLFRADVASAKSCKLLTEKQSDTGILLETDDTHRVRYLAGENGVQRIVETGDKVAARETFYLGDRHRATLTMSTDALRVVRCTIDSVTSLTESERHLTGAKPPAALVITAIVGRSGRTAESIRKATARPKATPEPAPESDSDEAFDPEKELGAEPAAKPETKPVTEPATEPSKP